jgi:hypothetical protein
MAGSYTLPAAATLEIPYIQEDNQGCFTKILIHEVATHSGFTYHSAGANYRLEGALLPLKESDIGYRYEQSLTGVVGKRLVASELQLSLAATIAIIEKKSSKYILRPITVSETIYLDF